MSRPGVTEWFEPRDRVAAARTLTIAAVVAAVTTVGFEVVAVATGRVGSSRETLVVAIVIGLVLLVAARTYSTRAETLPALAWTAIAVFGVGVVVWVGLGTLDGSAAGQIGLVYPVVYASAHLRRPVALGVWALAVVADAAVAFSVLPFAVAAADVAVITAALFMLTSVLLTVGHHQDRLTEQLAELASADALTGLATRRELERAAGVALGPRVVRRRDRTEPAGVGLLIVDLDLFKQLNDTYGHVIGDAALIHLADLLRSAVPHNATAARLGGDELAALIPECTAECVEGIAEDLLARVRRTPMISGIFAIDLSVSIGTAHLPLSAAPPATGLARLYGAADAALYRAKVEGRDRVVVS